MTMETTNRTPTRGTASCRPALVLLFAVLLAGCASGPQFQAEGVDPDWTPARVVDQPNDGVGRPVIWGGRILKVDHLEDATQLEVLAFPLDRSQRPLIARQPVGRFLIESPDYLEPVDFQPGRQITVFGTVDRLRDGRVGERRIQYPLVLPDDELHLWREAAQSGSQVRFGVGIQLGL